MPTQPVTKEIKIKGVMEEKPSPVITSKELFERLVVVETLVNEQGKTNRKTERKFAWFAVAIFIVEAINFLLNIIIIQNHLHLQEML